MNLDELQSMWERDSKMDMDNLHDESLKIPQLHQKYFTLYTTTKLLKKKAEDTISKVRLERHNYYSGKAPAEVYVEEPFPYKVRDKESMSLHLNADEKLTKVKLKNVTNGATMVYSLVAEKEADIKQSKISVSSPIGKGLLGKKVGEIAEIQVPRGVMSFEILEITSA